MQKKKQLIEISSQAKNFNFFREKILSFGNFKGEKKMLVMKTNRKENRTFFAANNK